MNHEGGNMTDENKKKESQSKFKRIHNWLNNGDYTIGGTLSAEDAVKINENGFVIMPKPSTPDKEIKIYEILMVLLQGEVYSSQWTIPQNIFTLKKTMNWKIHNLEPNSKAGKYVLDKKQLEQYRNNELVVFKSNISVPQFGPDPDGEFDSYIPPIHDRRSFNIGGSV